MTKDADQISLTHRVKGYIQVAEGRMEPLIYYLIKNAINAGDKRVLHNHCV